MTATEEETWFTHIIKLLKQSLISRWLQEFAANHTLNEAVNHDKMCIYFDVGWSQTGEADVDYNWSHLAGNGLHRPAMFHPFMFHIYMWGRFPLRSDDVSMSLKLHHNKRTAELLINLSEVVTVQRFVSSQAAAKRLKLPWQQQMGPNVLARADAPRLPRWVDRVLLMCLMTQELELQTEVATFPNGWPENGPSHFHGKTVLFFINDRIK